MNSRVSPKKTQTKISSARSSESGSQNLDTSSQHQSLTDSLGHLTPANASNYQRLFGNQFVLQMMRQSNRGILQRNEESAELLKKLATPQIKPGPQVEAQKELVKALDKNDDFKSGTILNLGGILFDGELGEDKNLFKQARFVVLLPSMKGYISAGQPRSEKLSKYPELVELLMLNILSTMIDAQQIEYLRKAGLPNKDWKILVEMHYYRERDMSQTGFHKDTLGETLFVNLNYHMERTVLGPEFVVNPRPSESHDEQTKDTLPEEFRKDLQVTRDQLGEPTEYGTGIVNPYDYVAFVDEAIHHATPHYYHRHVTGKNLDDYLNESDSAKLKEAKRAYTAYTKRNIIYYGYGFGSYVNKTIIPENEIPKWQTLAELVANDTGKITRNDLKGAMTDEQFDDVIDWTGSKGGERTKGATPGFHSVSIPKVGGTQPINRPERPRLKRQLSNPEFRKKLPPPPPEKDSRAFFRTWVRVIPAEKAEVFNEK